ncbi:MAG: DNA methyltransferase [Acidimicrobiaceae bacterium]|nr:DNA methyltransferase [Acidimicrobiaceae bacterium]
MSSPSNLSNPDDSAYQHASASRPNQPTSETAPLMDDHQRAPEAFHAGRRFPAGFADVYADAVKQQTPHLNKDLSGHPLLAWDRSGTTSLLTGDASIDEVHGFAGSPLFTREKVTPALLLEQLRRPGGGAELQLDFDGLDEGADEYDWYRHSGRWQNRLIHGDSAAVMQSLIAKDRMAGQVQMIYFDPPYGMGFKSNFQTATKKLETPEKLDGVPVGDTLPLRAFRDSYRNGIHSYLDGIHERTVLARELLTDTGSLFVQIGDENVHRLALVLDEVFGPENRVATITYRPATGSSARTLPESASYVLWYARDKSKCKFRQIYESMSDAEIIAQWGKSFAPARLELPGGKSRNLTADEQNAPESELNQGAVLFCRQNLTSMGSSTTGRTREIIYRGERYHCGNGRHWCVSVHDGDAPVCTPPDDNGARTEA